MAKAIIKKHYCLEKCPHREQDGCVYSEISCRGVAYQCPNCDHVLITHFVSIDDSYGLKVGVQGEVVCPVCKEVVGLTYFYPQTELDHLYGELHLDRILDLDEK